MGSCQTSGRKNLFPRVTSLGVLLALILCLLNSVGGSRNRSTATRAVSTLSVRARETRFLLALLPHKHFQLLDLMLRQRSFRNKVNVSTALSKSMSVGVGRGDVGDVDVDGSRVGMHICSRKKSPSNYCRNVK